MDINKQLRLIGMSDKEASVYQALLKLGPSPVRAIAKEADVNRGTTYDILKSLLALGVVSYYNKAKSQYFVAENPDKLIDYLDHKQDSLDKMKDSLSDVVPLLKSVYDKAAGQPVVRFYDGYDGAAFILKDVLATVSQLEKREYFSISSSSAAFVGAMYKNFPNFTKERIKKKISVKVVAVGDRGEIVPALAMRKYLSKELKNESPAYILIYGHKVASVALDSANVPWGIIIQDAAINATQRLVFESLWKYLD